MDDDHDIVSVRLACLSCSHSVSHHMTHLFSHLAVNGNTKEELLTNKTSQQVLEVLTKLTDQSGQDIIRIRKPFHTDSPSIQGQWHPFTHRPPSVGLIRPQNQHGE